MVKVGITLATLLAGSVTGAALGQTIADSMIDFTNAANDGIGVGGAPVTPGSPLDAAQQFHTDSTGSGDWRYGYGTRADGGSFGGGFPLLSVWDNTFWTETGSVATVRASGQHPFASSFGADSLTYRRWTSNGAHTGETLTARLSVTLNSDLSDGVTIIFNVNNVAGHITALIEPGLAGVEQTFEIDFVDVPDNWVLVAVDPSGIDPPSANNFLHDFTQTRLTIVPAPGAAALMGLGVAACGRRRRVH